MNNVFKKYKDLHKGERVFLIANGPSLNDTDLDLIKNETSFAMNRISLKYKDTAWRPTYYIFSSTNVRSEKPWHKEWRESVIESVEEEKTTCFIADQFRSDVDPYGIFPHIRWFRNMSEIKPKLNGDIDQRCFSTDVVERIDKTGTSMNLALQLCYHMGFSEIILVGSDLGWTKDSGTKSDPNHFDKSYTAEISRPEKANHQMRNVHSLAYLNFKQRGDCVKIYNASNKSVLDVYPIIDYQRFIQDDEIVILNNKVEKARKFWNKPPQFGGYYQDGK
jgi:hypothetical protein